MLRYKKQDETVLECLYYFIIISLAETKYLAYIISLAETKYLHQRLKCWDTKNKMKLY